MQQQLMNIQKWVQDRDFKGGATLIMQQVKGEEELSEMYLASQEYNREELLDGIGDSCVVLVAQCEIAEIDLEDVFLEPEHITNFNEYNLLMQAGIYHGRMAKAIAKSQPKDVLTTHMVDFFQTLYGLAHCLGEPIEKCMEVAYGEIKDRKGKWISGSFVKEADL